MSYLLAGLTPFFEYFLQLGGPYIPILFGRRDSRVSLKSSADKIPPPQGDVTSFLKFFAERGINTEQAVALMGTYLSIHKKIIIELIVNALRRYH